MSTSGLRKGSKCIRYVGNRPSCDPENACREKLCLLVKDVGCFHEICPEKLYLVNLARDENSDDFCERASSDPKCPFIFWNLRDSPSITYEPFNMDFGPFNLAVTHEFISKIKIWLDTMPLRYPDKYIAIVLDDRDVEKKLNTTLLVAIAAMVLLNLNASEVIRRLNFFMMYKYKPGEPSKQLLFREKKKFSDVSGGQSIMTLKIEDCIEAFYAALNCKFYDYYTFDQTEYLFYETVMSGDLNWIIPGKLLAFAGPSDKAVNLNENSHPPSFYYHYFKDHNVTTIVRLNDPEYRSQTFREMGFEHYDLIFPDGCSPTSTIAAKFIRIVNNAAGAVAVHCYAGIGRTGTLIAAYLMAMYSFTPQWAVAWTRICRPGSVINGQQDWLLARFNPYSITGLTVDSKYTWEWSRSSRTRRSKVASSTEAVADTMTTPSSAKTIYADAEKTHGQAKALSLTKKQREQQDKRRTRSYTTRISLEDDETSARKVLVQDKDDLVLDLGKSIPPSLCLVDLLELKGASSPKFYRLKDNKYEWKVKFPQAGYVQLKHDYHRDYQLVVEANLEPESIVKEPLLYLTFDHGEEDTPVETSSSSSGDTFNRIPPRLKPIVYYSLMR